MSRCTNHGKRTTSTAIGRLVVHCCATCDVIVATTTMPAPDIPQPSRELAGPVAGTAA